MIELVAGLARVTVVDDIGAGLGGVWVAGRPVLRPWSGRGDDGPFALAMNLLMPFSNRISGGFRYDGAWHAMPPNLPDELFVLHGDAFLRPWTPTQRTADTVTLRLSGAIAPFRYDAAVSYRLTKTALHVNLTLTNRAAVTLPHGLGFHPWFPRDGDTRVQFRATGYWPEDARHLPITAAPVALPPGLDFGAPAPLPDGWINAGFDGWTGTARIAQGPHAVGATVTSPLTTALLYSPSATAGFFCFEPVSHPVDAHNLPGLPGLVPLAPGDMMTARLTLDWS